MINKINTHAQTHTCTLYVSGLVTSDYGVLEVGVTVCGSCKSWVRNQIVTSFPYNENPTRALNTTSLKYCLTSTDAVDRRVKIHACVWSFKVASCKRASLKSDSSLTDYYICGCAYVYIEINYIEIFHMHAVYLEREKYPNWFPGALVLYARFEVAFYIKLMLDVANIN